MGNFIRNNKYIALIICIALIITISLIIKFTSKKPEGQSTTSITLEEYKKYDQYGLKYENDESEIFDVLTKIIDKDNLELRIENGDHKSYVDKNNENIEDIMNLLPSCNKIGEISYAIDNGCKVYYIDYNNTNDKRIILSYSSNGVVTKTLAEKDKILFVTNELILQTYYLK